MGGGGGISSFLQTEKLKLTETDGFASHPAQ